jgi:hypothetical protein
LFLFCFYSGIRENRVNTIAGWSVWIHWRSWWKREKVRLLIRFLVFLKSSFCHKVLKFSSILSSFRTLNFEDFKNMLERMKNGQLSTTTGVPSLIREGLIFRYLTVVVISLCEYHIWMTSSLSRFFFV